MTGQAWRADRHQPQTGRPGSAVEPGAYEAHCQGKRQQNQRKPSGT
jgi:hypothetical protein